MRLGYWLAALGVAGVVFLAGRFALGALAPNDWRKDLLPIPPRSVAQAPASVPASGPAVGEEKPATPASAPAIVDSTPMLRSVEGTVERKGRVGSWQSVAAGDRFDPGSSLRTATDSSAEIASSMIASLVLSASTTMQFDKELTKIWLDSGELKVRIAEGGEPLEIAARDGRARLRGLQGSFRVQAKPSQIIVFSQDARAELIAAGKTVELGPDTISWVVAGRPPAAPFAADHKPELKVIEPRATKVATPSIVIKGQTEPLTDVAVNGTPAKVDARGGFTAVVPLVEGENAIAVVARLFTGTESRQELAPITRVKKLAAPAAKKPAIKWGPGQ